LHNDKVIVLSVISYFFVE